jgi:hypothetical protein
MASSQDWSTLLSLVRLRTSPHSRRYGVTITGLLVTVFPAGHPGFHACIHPHMHTSHHNAESLPAALPTCKQPCSVDGLCLNGSNPILVSQSMHAYADDLLMQPSWH